jgi:hypothetical protein
MAVITPVNVGAAPGDGTGDLLRNAFIKLNANDSAVNAQLDALANVFPTRASLLARNLPAAQTTVRTSGYATAGDGGGGVYQRVGAEPAHSFKFQSLDGTWWELDGPQVRPQQIGHLPANVSFDLSTLVAALETATRYDELFLTQADWVTTALFSGSRIKISGPGASRLLFKDTWVNTGERLVEERTGDRRTHAQATAPRTADASPVERFAVANRSAALSIPNISNTLISFDAEGIDAMGGFRSAFSGGTYVAPGPSRTAIFLPPGTRAIEVNGGLTFAANATGERTVFLYSGASLIGEVTVSPGTRETYVSLDFGILPVAASGAITLQVYQDSGGALNITTFNMSVRVVAIDSAVTPGNRLKIFQGDWVVEEAKYATWAAFVRAVAAYDVLALSHIEAIGVAPYPLWSGTSPAFVPGVGGGFANIVDYGYKKLKQLIYDVKVLKPTILVFGYVSAAIDAPLWSSSGNPCRASTFGTPGAFEDPVASGNYYVNDNTWSPGTYQNVQQWIDLWQRDKSLPIDGIFFDHFASPFLPNAARDTVVGLAKKAGMKVMVNITGAGSANVEWAAACPYLTHGDYMCLEGFYRDNGTDVVTETNNTIAAILKLAARGIWLAAVNEEAAATPIVNGSINDLNGKSLFNLYAIPGWCYEYGRVTYDQIGTPAI